MRLPWITVLAVLGSLPAISYTLLTVGMRWGMYDFRVVFGQFKLLTYSATAGAVLLAVAAVALIFRRRPMAGALALILCTVSVAMALTPTKIRDKAQAVPPIHDITTDPADPPQFVATAPLRTDGMNPPEYDADQLPAQREAYPDIQPLDVPATPERAFVAVERAMPKAGIRIVARSPLDGTIEGTATSRWFGFKDDVIVRIRPLANGGSVIDMRSKSRVGRSDLGANAERLRKLRVAILDDLSG